MLRAFAALICTVLLTAPTIAVEKPDLWAVLTEARQLKQKGDYANALKKHVWLHENAMRIDSSFVGVRLSFALSDWITLGEKYPEARKKLVEVRDTTAKRLRNGELDFSLFMDVEAIDQHLKEPAHVCGLFKELHHSHPEFAAQCYHVMGDVLMAQGEFKLCRLYTKNPEVEVTSLTARRADLIAFAEKQTGSAKTSMTQAADRMFTRGVTHLVNVLIANDELEEAEKVHQQGLRVLKTPSFVNALSDARKKFSK